MHSATSMLGALLVACSPAADPGVFGETDGSGATVPDTTATGTTLVTTGGEVDESTSSSDDGRIRLDVAPGDIGGGSVCDPGEALDAVIGDCTEDGPPESFEPALEWSFEHDPETGERILASVIPLVGNFTDDNDDGRIDLCDAPDVVLVGGPNAGNAAACPVWLLDGATGAVHWKIPQSQGVVCLSTPAFADIDGDHRPELVALRIDEDGPMRLAAFEDDGSVTWLAAAGGEGASVWERQSGAVAIHDLDADGDVEILYNREVYDHRGELLWDKVVPLPFEGQATFATDLDDDGDLEVVMGNAAYHHDGTMIFDHYDWLDPEQGIRAAIAQVADLDDDGAPELLLTTPEGIALLEADGTLSWGPATPTGVPPDNVRVWLRPAAIHDLDGDDRVEAMSSAAAIYAAYAGPTAQDVLWQSPVRDTSGVAGGTAFDFLGDGHAEAMYGDECYFRVYDGGSGAVQLEQPRCSLTMVEYPVVADVDSDGSAEILVVSNRCPVDDPCDFGNVDRPALQVFGEARSRWVPARRIWNQHAYHVTHVREDGTVPRDPTPSWRALNTFRTQAQIDPDGTICDPEG
jgi:hypothetical protein